MRRYKFTVNHVFLLFTVAVLLALVLPDLLQHGMFMDGTQYAIIAKNYAEGKGTFWFPFLSTSCEKHGQNAFLEHPPLIYFLQSFFFKLGGDSFLCERMYCLLMLLLSACLIGVIWREIFKKNERYKDFFWFPILLWIIIPTVSWSFKSNMHENTLGVFVLASVYFLLRSVHDRKYIFVLLSGVFVFLGTFSKGLPGLFPIVFYVIYYFCFRDITVKKVVGNTVLVLLVPVLTYFLLVKFNTAAKESLYFHVKERLLYRIANNPQVESRWIVLYWLFCDLLVPIALLLPISGFMFSKRKIQPLEFDEPGTKKYFFLFLLLGLCGVLPLALTLVQRAVYYAPALPFLSIALALLTIAAIDELVALLNKSKKALRFFAVLSGTLLCVVIIYSCFVFGGIWRDEAEFNDANKIANVTGKDNYISSKAEIYQEWGFQYYLLRYYNVTIDPNSKQRPYFLIDKNELLADTNYADTQLELSRYKLFRRKN